jgi:hypothetical protein
MRRAALLWGGVFVIGISVSAIQWLPTADLSRHAIRGLLDHLEYMTFHGYTPRHLPTLVFPHYLGSSAYATYQGEMYFWELCGYVGLLALPLAAWGAVRRRRRAWPLVVIGVVGLALAFGRGNPIYLALQYVPVVNSFRAAGRYLLLWTIAGAALAAEGAEVLLEARSARSRATLWVEIAAVSVAGACVALPLWFQDAWPRNNARPMVLPSEWMFLAVSLALVGVLVAATRAGGSRRLLWACLGGAVVADLLAFAMPLAPVRPVAALYGRKPWSAQQVAADPTWCRVWGWRTLPLDNPYAMQPWPWARGIYPYLWDEDRLRSNLTIHWGLRGVECDAVFMRDLEYLNLTALTASLPRIEPGFRLIRPIADLLGVKYLLLGFPDPTLPLVGRGDQLWLYRNPNALPRGWVVGAAEAAPDERAEVAAAIGLPHRAQVALDAPPPISLTTPGEIPSKITFEEPRPEILRLQTRTAAPGMLVVSELYDPDWQVSLDGKETRLYRANHLVRAVYLPAGDHLVEFRYDNRAYRIGLCISLFMAALWTVLGLRAWSRRRRPGVA